MRQQFTDEEIITAIQTSRTGYDAIFDYLFYHKEWRKQAFAFINANVTDEDEREVIYVKAITRFIQEVRKNSFEPKSKLATFFIAICKNMSIWYAADEKKRMEKEEDYRTRMSKEPSSGELSDLFAGELSEKLKNNILNQLSDKCRTYIRQRYWAGLSALKMAVLGNVKKQSIDNAMARCKDRLRELIVKDAEFMKQVKLNYGKL